MIWNFVPTVKKVVRLTVLLYLKDGTLAPYFAKTASDCRNALRLCGGKPFEHNSSWSARNHSCLDRSSVDLSIFLSQTARFDMPWRCCLKVYDPCRELQLHSVAPTASNILSKINGSDIWPQDCLNIPTKEGRMNRILAGTAVEIFIWPQHTLILTGTQSKARTDFGGKNYRRNGCPVFSIFIHPITILTEQKQY